MDRDFIKSLQRQATQEYRSTGSQVNACLKRIPNLRRCPSTINQPQTYSVRLVLDVELLRSWPNWKDRVHSLMGCVNHFFNPINITWKLADLLQWRPLHAPVGKGQILQLMAQLKKEVPFDKKSFVVGLAASHNYSAGAVTPSGLNQGYASIATSMPKLENECLYMAAMLGRVLGGIDTPGRQWIMGWHRRGVFFSGPGGLARIKAKYRFHPRNLTTFVCHKSARFSGQRLLLPTPCRQIIKMMDGCWSKGTFDPL